MKFYKDYGASAHNASDGGSNAGRYPFVDSQAADVGAVLTDKGLPEWAAHKLIDQWNRRGRVGSITYRYWL